MAKLTLLELQVQWQRICYPTASAYDVADARKRIEDHIAQQALELEQAKGERDYAQGYKEGLEEVNATIVEERDEARRRLKDAEARIRNSHAFLKHWLVFEQCSDYPCCLFNGIAPTEDASTSTEAQ